MADPYVLPPRLLALLEDMPLEQLAFTPVPVKARHDGWTVERQKWFILRLALSGSVSMAARGVGMTRRSAYRLLDRPGSESFTAAWARALGWGQDRTLDRSLERSLLGERVPIAPRRPGRRRAPSLRQPAHHGRPRRTRPPRRKPAARRRPRRDLPRRPRRPGAGSQAGAH